MTIAFAAVVTVRFLLPLAIPRYPLPAIIACLIVDGIDQTIFQKLGYDPPGYQGYDKAMDVYYLAIAYLATMRNWMSMPAYRVGQFLYFYRLVGVVAFELSQVRALLLIFPNTFEYFFIAYEAIRTRWSGILLSLRWWIVAAGLIWVFIKLPQEYWIHVAQLDVTDTLAEYSWFGPAIVLGILALLGVFWFLVRPRLPQPDWSWKVEADPLPEEMDTAAERAAWRADEGAVRSLATVEKVVLVGLISVIFGQTLPDVSATNLQLFLGVGAVVVTNAAITLAAARRARTLESAAATFAVRTLLNVILVALAEWLLGREGGSLSSGDTFFFLMLISLITTLHDRYSPVLAYRQRKPAGEVTPQP